MGKRSGERRQNIDGKIRSEEFLLCPLTYAPSAVLDPIIPGTVSEKRRRGIQYLARRADEGSTIAESGTALGTERAGSPDDLESISVGVGEEGGLEIRGVDGGIGLEPGASGLEVGAGGGEVGDEERGVAGVASRDGGGRRRAA